MVDAVFHGADDHRGEAHKRVILGCLRLGVFQCVGQSGITWRYLYDPPEKLYQESSGGRSGNGVREPEFWEYNDLEIVIFFLSGGVSLSSRIYTRHGC
jgi:hypothetical protein